MAKKKLVRCVMLIYLSYQVFPKTSELRLQKHMRITIATGPSFPVPALRGGAAARLWQGLAEEFARRGHDVCIVARSFTGQPSEEIIRDVRYIRWGGFSQSLSIYVDLLRDFLY